MSPTDGSPVPKTRVEKVDDEPAHGEVPGTDAHSMRQADAKPDEISVPQEGKEEEEEEEEDSESSRSIQSDNAPVTVVEEAPGPVAPHSTEFENKRRADTTPDVVVESNGDSKDSDSEEPNNCMRFQAPHKEICS